MTHLYLAVIWSALFVLSLIVNDIRTGLVALLPLILLTVALNALTGGKPWQTFSARAWASSGGQHWARWVRVVRVVDAVCRWERAHCRARWAWEDAHGGSVWRAWAAEWRAAA